MKTFHLVDLCAGTGAFSLAFENHGQIASIYANDCESSAKCIYDHNVSSKLVLKDIHDIDNSELGTVDILTAGFPCQPFSIAGEQKGFDDTRSNVFWKIISIMENKRPRIVILENVKNLITHDEGKTFGIIIGELEKLGYLVKYSVLNTCKITQIPQNRERVYIVCFADIRDWEKFDFPMDRDQGVQGQLLPIVSMLETHVDRSYYYTEKLKVWNVIKDSVVKHVNTGTTYQYRRYYVRENKCGICPTLTANMGAGGHNVPLILDDVGIRKLTPRECFNFQGFPNNYVLPDSLSDGKLYKLAGNAVSYLVIEQIVGNIMRILNEN